MIPRSSEKWSPLQTLDFVAVICCGFWGGLGLMVLR
jgi:hypothetical protein